MTAVRQGSSTEYLPPRLFILVSVFTVTFGTFVGGLWASAGIGGGIALFGATWFLDRRMPRPDPTVTAFVLALLGTILFLDIGAAYPSVSWQRLWQEATILLPLAALSSPAIQARIEHPRFWPIVARAALLGAVALGIEFLAGTPLLFALKGTGTGVTFYNRGISYLAVFAFPILAFLWCSGRRWEAALFVAVLAVPAVMTDSRATRAALVLGLVTVVLAVILPLAVRVLLNLVVLALMAMPWAVTSLFLSDQSWIRRMPPSWQHRVEIWDYTSYRIFERPWQGWGIGSSRLLDYVEPHGANYVWITEKAGHPHNSILQLWVELGVPGLMLGAAFALFLLWRCSAMPRPIRPFAYGAWLAGLCVSLVAYNFWDDSLFSLFALTMLAFRRLAAWSGGGPIDRHRKTLVRHDVDATLADRQPVPQIGRVAMDH